MRRSVKVPPTSMPATRRVRTPCLEEGRPGPWLDVVSIRTIGAPVYGPPEQGARRQPWPAPLENLAGIENALGIEGSLDGAHQVQFHGTAGAPQRLALHDTDAML